MMAPSNSAESPDPRQRLQQGGGEAGAQEHMTLALVHSCTIQEMAALASKDLARLQMEANEAFENARQTRELLDSIIARRFGDRAATMRQESGKEFGIIRFQDGEVEVAMDVPKRPSWDQEKLAGIVRTIREAGDDPAQYVKTAYEVEERKFTAWPDNIRRVFEPARTVKPGKASFKLSLREKEAA